MKKTNKYLCIVCCVILLLSAVPYTGMAGMANDGGIICMISARVTSRFSAYMPHSLSHGDIPGKCVWIKSAETGTHTNQGREMTENRCADIQPPDSGYTLLRSVFDNHLGYCKREIYHLLI